MNKLTLKKVGWSLGAVGALAIAAACSSGGGGGGGDGGINCGTGSTQCGDTCTVIARDTQNCGACGKACAASELCSAGTCVPAAGGCTMGTTKCGNECVDTKSDDRNCGMCGTKCGTNKVCSMGACADDCAMGTSKCGNSCVNQQTDRTNCGGCGTTCKDGEICSAGKCTLSCQQGLTKCAAQPLDAGAPDSGSSDAAADGAADGAADAAAQDSGGPQIVGDYCANLQTDNQNCGGCGITCPSGKVCSNGACATSCGQPLSQCGQGNNAYCANLTSDDANCGQCGTPCGAGLKCVSSTCTLTCGGGATQCGNACVDTKTNPSHCGACNQPCGQGQACVNSTCQKLALTTFVGPQTNVPIASLSGWTQCYIDNYANSSTTLAAIQAQCNQANLLLGCRVTGSNTLLVAAHAPRTDVLFDTGTTNTPHNANGSGWYYNNSYSWGFALQGDALSRSSCDTGNTNPERRLCWHTGGGNINGGWRCGTNTGLNASVAYERIVYQAP